jgi:hypothetical protein
MLACSTSFALLTDFRDTVRFLVLTSQLFSLGTSKALRIASLTDCKKSLSDELIDAHSPVLVLIVSE